MGCGASSSEETSFKDELDQLEKVTKATHRPVSVVVIKGVLERHLATRKGFEKLNRVKQHLCVANLLRVDREYKQFQQELWDVVCDKGLIEPIFLTLVAEEKKHQPLFALGPDDEINVSPTSKEDTKAAPPGKDETNAVQSGVEEKENEQPDKDKNDNEPDNPQGDESKEPKQNIRYPSRNSNFKPYAGTSAGSSRDPKHKLIRNELTVEQRKIAANVINKWKNYSGTYSEKQLEKRRQATVNVAFIQKLYYALGCATGSSEKCAKALEDHPQAVKQFTENLSINRNMNPKFLAKTVLEQSPLILLNMSLLGISLLNNSQGEINNSQHEMSHLPRCKYYSTAKTHETVAQSLNGQKYPVLRNLLLASTMMLTGSEVACKADEKIIVDELERVVGHKQEKEDDKKMKRDSGIFLAWELVAGLLFLSERYKDEIVKVMPYKALEKIIKPGDSTMMTESQKKLKMKECRVCAALLVNILDPEKKQDLRSKLEEIINHWKALVKKHKFEMDTHTQLNVEIVISLANVSTDTTEKMVNKNGKIFISYRQNEGLIVKRIEEDLKNEGYEVWIDYKEMKGTLVESMAQGIDRASVVLTCFSEEYEKSHNCKSEALYAQTRQKEIIPIKLTEYVPAEDWLAFIVRPRLYYDFWEDYDSSMKNLLEALSKLEIVKKVVKKPVGQKGKQRTNKQYENWTHKEVREQFRKDFPIDEDDGEGNKENSDNVANTNNTSGECNDNNNGVNNNDSNKSDGESGQGSMTSENDSDKKKTPGNDWSSKQDKGRPSMRPYNSSDEGDIFTPDMNGLMMTALYEMKVQNYEHYHLFLNTSMGYRGKDIIQMNAFLIKWCKVK